MLAIFGAAGDDLHFWGFWLFPSTTTGNKATLEIKRSSDSSLCEETIAFSCDDKSLFA
jgi:hypothetical protein